MFAHLGIIKKFDACKIICSKTIEKELQKITPHVLKLVKMFKTKITQNKRENLYMQRHLLLDVCSNTQNITQSVVNSNNKIFD